MRLLPDSHAVYWWMIGCPRLSATARAALRRNAVESLAITHEHVEIATHLAWDHRAP